MSFNLFAEGAFDYEAIASRVRSFEPLEVFPIPPSREGELQALGIACPLSRWGDDAAHAIDSIVHFLWAAGARVYELWGGSEITGDAELAEVCANVR
jgi:hypothetical protein